jgi:hypothetical protein
MKTMKFLILDYNLFNEKLNNMISIKTCPYCSEYFLRVSIKRNINLLKCDSCEKKFSENKVIIKEFEYNKIYKTLDNNSSDSDKKEVFSLLRNNIFKFSNRKNIDDSIINFLKVYYININIDGYLTYKKIFDFLNNTKYENCHCKNKNCSNETKFTGFRLLDRYPNGYYLFCGEKCYHEWFGEKQVGSGNTLHRMSFDKIPEYKKKLSDIMKGKIERGEFKPNIHNSWRNTKYKVIINGIELYFRSSWEAFFNLVNPSFTYETRRVSYVHNKEKHTYIIDFDDSINRVLYEIKPTSLESIDKNLDKKNAAIIWCKNNNYKFVIINDEWFKINYKKFKYLLDNQPEEIRLKRNLRRYEN